MSAVTTSSHQSRSCFAPNPNSQAPAPHSTPNNQSSPSLMHQLPLLTPSKPKSLIAVEEEGDETCKYWEKAKGPRGETRCSDCVKFVQSRVDAHLRVVSVANTSVANKDHGPATVSTIFCWMNRLKSFFIICPPRKHVYRGLTCGLENRICNKLDFYESFTDINQVGSGGGRGLVWATHATKYQWNKVAKYTNETRYRHLYSIQKKSKPHPIYRVTE
jgi:hypothetical protein